MKLTKRTAALALCMTMALVGVVSGTVAYLTDTSSITNTFTVGNVDITLDETMVNAKGEPVDADGKPVTDPTAYVRRPEGEGNEYHLIPAASYTKDPMITVVKGSEEAYIRMLVTITDYADLVAACGGTFDYAAFFTGMTDAKWVYVEPAIPGSDIVNNARTLEFRYAEPVSTMDAAENLALVPLFTGFTIPGTATKEQLAELTKSAPAVDPEHPETAQVPMTINVAGHAIQSASFGGDVDAAWTAFDGQYGSAETAEIPDASAETEQTEDGADEPQTPETGVVAE